MYHHTVPTTKTLTFKKEIVTCPGCGKDMEKHIVCEGARFHVLSWDTNGEHCSESNCEVNHRRKHRLERKKNRLST